MDKEFLSKFINSLLSSAFYTFLLSGFLYLLASDTSDPYSIPIIVFVLVWPFVFYGVLKDNIVKGFDEVEKQLKDNEEKFNKDLADKDSTITVREAQINILESTTKEKSSGYPTLHESIDYFHSLVDKNLADELIIKSHPAYRAAEEVKEQSKRRRDAEKKQKITQSIIEFYENLEPSLIDYKNEEFGNMDEMLKEWTDEEKQDPVSYFLSKEEYRNLSVTDKNQLALDRYWKRPHSKWQIGIMYERYIGYLYEMQGYDVNYHGIEKRKEDLGRDLIAQKGNEVVVIQCKYWNQFRKVFENEIFQFFGTVFQYRKTFKDKKVTGIFYTTTSTSDLAREFAKELGITLKENYKMDKSYPCIKCNISKVDGERIYHLPFDQQYNHTKIEPKTGELYVATVKEAELNRFRRAWRWKGT